MSPPYGQRSSPSDAAEQPSDSQQQQHQRELCRQRVVRLRERETVDERVQRLELERRRAAVRRRNETAAERETRRLKGRLRALRRRECETEQERARRKEQNRLRMAQRRQMLKDARQDTQRGPGPALVAPVTAAPAPVPPLVPAVCRPDPLPPLSLPLSLPLPLVGSSGFGLRDASTWGHASMAPLIHGLGSGPPGLAAALALGAILPEPPPPPPLSTTAIPSYLAAHINRQRMVDNGMRLAFGPAAMAPHAAEQPAAPASSLATAASVGSLAHQGLAARIHPPPPLTGIFTSLAAAIATASYAHPQTNARPVLGPTSLAPTALAQSGHPPPIRTPATFPAGHLPPHFASHYHLPP
ncbi:hypothetical protein H4R19_000269 [Coemansia spiralis]|nr:hypothetical protein H4R19_000269 [Coemansia spiralis]